MEGLVAGIATGMFVIAVIWVFIALWIINNPVKRIMKRLNYIAEEVSRIDGLQRIIRDHLTDHNRPESLDDSLGDDGEVK